MCAAYRQNVSVLQILHTVVDICDIIIHANFCDHWFEHFSNGRGRNLGFSIDLYNTLAVRCQRVIQSYPIATSWNSLRY